MKKSLAFLLAATTVATITTPALTISCGDKESKEKKEFKEEIAKLEAQIKEKDNLKAETKIALEKIASDAKLQLNKLKTPEEFKKATEELKKKIEEAKKEKNEGSPVTPPPSKPGDSTPPKKPEETTPGGSHSTTPKTPTETLIVPPKPATPAPVTPPNNSGEETPSNSEISKKYKMPELYDFSEKGNLFEIVDKKLLKDEFDKILKSKKHVSIRIDKGIIKASKDNKTELKSIKFNPNLKNFANVNTHSAKQNIGWHFKGEGVRKGIYLEKISENKYVLKWKLITTKDDKITKEEKEYSQVFEIK